MSVSVSSVYEQTQSLRQIQEKIELAATDQYRLESIIQQIVNQASNLTMVENYRLVAILSKYINNNSSVLKKYVALYTIKQLILTALHHFYIFTSVRVLPIIASLSQFEGKKSESQRIKLYVRQLSLKGNGDGLVQQRYCFKFIKFVDEFLNWFSTNIPTHINAQYEYRSTFARVYQQLTFKRPIRSYQNFRQNQFDKFQRNFNFSKTINIQSIRDLTQFIILELRSSIDQNKFKSELLSGVIKTADSYCAKAIVSQICSLVEDSHKLYCCLKLADSLMSMGQIQFIQLTKLYIVPAILGYILPYNFVENKKLAVPQLSCTSSDQKCIINSINIWSRIAEKVGLSTEFYKRVILQFEKLNKPILKVQEKNLNDFYTNVLDMEGVNSDKKSFIRQPYIQKQLIALLDAEPERQIIKKINILDHSAINDLDEFKQNDFQKASQAIQQQRKAEAGPFFVQQCNFNNNLGRGEQNSKSSRSSKKGLTVVGLSPQNIVTFKQVKNQVYNQRIQPPMVNSAYKGSIKLSSSKKNNEQSSFMAFDASNTSNFSQYSVRKSKEELNGKLLLQNQHFNNQNSSISNQKSNSKYLLSKPMENDSGSVIYFKRSEYFHSEGSIKNDRLGMSNSSSQKSISKGNAQEPQTEMTTYRFETSVVSKSSSSSSIKNFGKEINHFPQPVSKPIFGFKRKQIQILQKSQQLIFQQNILGNENIFKPNNQVENNNKFLLKPQLLRESIEQSQIEDLSGGKHLFNKSIYSPFEQNERKMLLETQRMGTESMKFNLNPQAQYYESEVKKQSRGRQVNYGRAKKQSVIGSRKLLSARNLTQPDNAIKSEKNFSKKKTKIINEFGNDKFLGLQKQLGRAIQQKNTKQMELKKKENECKVLKSMSMPYMSKKMENLKKQNQIIKVLANQKNKQDYGTKAEQFIKPIKIKNKLTDYFLENQVIGTYTPRTVSYDRAFTKQILGSRCLLIANQNVELGYNYSSRQNQISLYLTFYKAFDLVEIKVVENSLILEKDVNLSLNDQPAGYQLKIKRKVKGISMPKKQPTFSSIINNKGSQFYKFPQIQINVSGLEGQHKMQAKVPCSVFNLAQPMEIDMQVVDHLKDKKVLRSQPLPLSQEFAKNFKQKIQKYFPLHMALVQGWKLIGFRFPNAIFGDHEDQFYKFRVINGKLLEIQYFDDGKSLLAQTLVCMLARSNN